MDGVLVEGLDPDAHRPHQCDHEERHQYDVGRGEGHEPVGRVEGPLHDEYEHDGRDHGGAHAHQVGEGGEAHHPLVGVEDAESGDEAEQEDPEGQHQRREYPEGCLRTVVDGIGQEPGEDHEEAVKYQDAPVGQRPPGEIPPGDVSDRIHKV